MLHTSGVSGRIPNTISNKNSKNRPVRKKNIDPSQNMSRKGKKRNRVCINVSGVIYETYEATLDRYPETLLGTSEKRRSLMDTDNAVIFFNRHRTAFEAVLFYYQSGGRLVRPPDLDMKSFKKECYFYEISIDVIKSMLYSEQYLFKRKRILPPEPDFGKLRNVMWKFLDSPSTFTYSWIAGIYFLLSYVLIVISIILFCLETEMMLDYVGDGLEIHLRQIKTLEVGLNLFFLVELFIRLFSNPWPQSFFFVPLNAIELFSFLAFLLAYMFPSTTFVTLWLFRLSRMSRALRLLRLSKWSKLVKTGSSVVQSSLKDVLAVCFVTTIIVILCGSILFYIEMEVPDTQFKSIPHSMWWAIQTVLCVGYGDITPTSVAGKSIGGCVLYLGVVTNTVLLLSLGGRIFDMYSKEVSNTDFLPSN